MPWCVAHAILAVRYKEDAQVAFPVWENMYLLEADNHAEALVKAIQRAQEDTGDARGTFMCDNRPATLVFEGIRKIIWCEPDDVFPRSGVEVSYSQYTADSESALQSLVKGDAVQVVYEE